MTRAKTAADAKNYDLAVKLLDNVIKLKPDYVEAFNRRATIFYVQNRYQESLADIREVLTREPRHFAALAGPGMIMQELGDDARALAAYRQALAINPHIERIPERVKSLTEKVDGRDILEAGCETARGLGRIFSVTRYRRTLRMSFIVFAVTVAVLVVVTQIGVFAIQKMYPPTGRFINVTGARLHVVELGPQDSPQLPVVLIHGASANLNSLRELGERLAQSRRVVLIDRPGHGWSTRDNLRASTPGIQAQMIDEALGKLNIPRAIIVGHSWAGALAAAFALDHPKRTAGLVLLSPVTHSWPGGIAWYHHVGTTPLIGLLFAHTLALPVGTFMMVPGAWAALLPQTMPEGYVSDTAVPLLLRPDEFLANAHDMATLKDSVTVRAPLYNNIAVPVVVITGDADKTVSPDIHSRAFAAAVPGAKLIVLPGVGHLVQNAALEQIVSAIETMPPVSLKLL